MSYIISINGNDGSGKTTQIDLLKKNSSKSTFFPPDIAKYGVFPKLPEKEAFEWWFFKSNIEEFCEAIYNGIKFREEQIKKQEKPMIILDKGIDTFEARIMANFMCRGMKQEDVLKIMSEIKQKVGIRDTEDIKLFLMLNTDKGKRREILKNRKGTSYGQSYYDRYQTILEKVTDEQLKKGIYNVVDASGSIEEVNNNIVSTIKTKLFLDKKIDDRECEI